MEAPFKHIDGSLYIQKDGVAMGSPLSCTIANFYMCELENKVLGENEELRPKIYCRYVDDIYVVTQDFDKLLALQQKLIDKSVLNFTREISIDNKLPFLDVLLDNSNNDNYATSIYVKPTKSQDCIDYECESPERYKLGLIKTLLNRAYKICSSREAYNQEKVRITKLLINNNFPNRVCDKIMQEFEVKKQRETDNSTAGLSDIPDNGIINQLTTNSVDARVDGTDISNKVKLYYRSQFHHNYRAEETALKRIIKRHVFEINIKIDFIIYYKSQKISNKIMKNNISAKSIRKSEKSHLVYEFTCNVGECMSLERFERF